MMYGALNLNVIQVDHKLSTNHRQLITGGIRYQQALEWQIA